MEHEDEQIYEAAPKICPHCGSTEGFEYAGFTRDFKLILTCRTCFESILVWARPIDPEDAE
jgi:hypothetical protein